MSGGVRGGVSQEYEIKKLKNRVRELENKIIKIKQEQIVGDGYWKVVCRTPIMKNRVYFSTDAPSEATRVYYKINEWAEAPGWLQNEGCHLLCYNMLNEAKKYAEQCGGYLFECEIQERVKLPKFVSDKNLIEKIIIRDPVGYFPKGVIAVKKLKLIGEELNYVVI